MLNLRLDICHRVAQSLNQRILGDSVLLLLIFHNLLVENPEIKPKKDYDDYTKHLNVELSDKKYK